MKKPMIKPSHRGLLHEKLGVPKGEKIGAERLEAAKRSGDPSIRKEANFALNFNHMGHHGYVTGVHAHHSRAGYAVIDVAHGKRSKRKDEKGNVMDSDYDDRPSSSIVIPKAHAGHYRVGQKVGVGAAPIDDKEELF